MAAVVLAAGCTVQVGPGVVGGSPAPTGSVAPMADDAVVFTFDSQGGFCPSPGCGTSQVFRVDGSFDVDDQRTGKRSGQIDKALVLALRREIAKADFKALKAVDRDKICGMVADAPTQTWTFTTATGKESFKACSVAFGSEPLFAAGQKLVSAVYETQPTPAPTTLPGDSGARSRPQR